MMYLEHHDNIVEISRLKMCVEIAPFYVGLRVVQNNLVVRFPF